MDPFGKLAVYPQLNFDDLNNAYSTRSHVFSN